MKKLVTILSVLMITGILLTGCATMGGGQATADMLVLTEIVEVPGVSKDDLFVRANSWMVDTFRSAEAVIQYTDKEAGIVKGKYLLILPIGMGEKMHVTSTVTVEMKDEKAKITFNDAYYKFSITVGSASSSEEGYVEDNKTITKVRADWESMVQNFKIAISNDSLSW